MIANIGSINNNEEDTDDRNPLLGSSFGLRDSLFDLRPDSISLCQ